MMKAHLVLLGIGGAFDADVGIANTSALLVTTANGGPVRRLLIDCGHTCGAQLHALGLTYEDIDAVVITHNHGDHIDGLETLGYKSLFLHRRRVPVYAPADVLPMTWSALKPKMGVLQVAAGEAIDAQMSTYFDPRLVDTQPAEVLPGVSAQFVPVAHVEGMPSYGIIIRCAGLRSVFWSGDCIFDAESPILTGAQEGDLIFHDCAIYPAYEATVHTHLEQLTTLPPQVRDRIVLVHHGQVTQDRRSMEGMHLGQPLERFDL